MELKLIEELAGVIARTAIEELEYARAGVRIRLQRRPAGGEALTQDHHDGARPVAAPVAAPATAALPDASPALESGSRASLHAVAAGMSGTFHGAPAPGESPFVKVGDYVQEGQVLAVVEAMKMLNQVEADVSGRVVRAALTDGTVVTPTTVLFEIELQDKPA